MPNKFKHNLEAGKSIYLHTHTQKKKSELKFKKAEEWNLWMRWGWISDLIQRIWYEDHFPVRIQNPNLIRIDPLSGMNGCCYVVMCIMCRVPEECVIYCDEDRPRLQASDWPELITWPQYWLLIGQFSATNTSHWLIVSRDELMTLISLLCLIFPVSQVKDRRDQSEGCVPSHWPIRSHAELVCRTFPCRFVTLELTPAAEEGDPNTIKHRLENILMGF